MIDVVFGVLVYLLGVLAVYTLFYVINKFIEDSIDKFTLIEVLPFSLFSWVLIVLTIVSIPLSYVIYRIDNKLKDSKIIEKLDKWFQGKTNESRND